MGSAGRWMESMVPARTLLGFVLGLQEFYPLLLWHHQCQCHHNEKGELHLSIIRKGPQESPEARRPYSENHYPEPLRSLSCFVSVSLSVVGIEEKCLALALGFHPQKGLSSWPDSAPPPGSLCFCASAGPGWSCPGERAGGSSWGQGRRTEPPCRLCLWAPALPWPVAESLLWNLTRSQKTLPQPSGIPLGHRPVLSLGFPCSCPAAAQFPISHLPSC